MILCHFAPRQSLPSILFDGGLDTGRVPMSTTRFMVGCPWLIKLTSDWQRGMPETEDMVCIRIDFPKSLSRKLVRWEPKGRDHLPRQFFHANNVETYYHRGPIAPARFLDVHDCAGNRILPEDVEGEPIIRGPKLWCPDDCTYVDTQGRDVTAEWIEPQSTDAWGAMWNRAGVS